MKKSIYIALFILALAIPSICRAADSAHAIAVNGDINSVVAIADGSSGAVAEVSSTSGALNVAHRAQAVTSQLGDAAMYTGACRVQSITVSGVSAGDTALIYDAASATGTPKFDIQVGTAADTKSIDCKGAPFATGIYADATDSEVFVSAVYDY